MTSNTSIARGTRTGYSCCRKDYFAVRGVASAVTRFALRGVRLRLRPQASAGTDDYGRGDQQQRAADERRRQRQMIEQQAAERGSEHDGQLNRADHQAAAALRLVGDAL